MQTGATETCVAGEYRNLFSLEGRVALITGAARGIGHAIATAMQAHGAAVILTDVDAVAGRRSTLELAAGSPPAHFLEMDVTASTHVERGLDEAWQRFGRVDILVNNAGISDRIAAEAYPDAEFDAMIDINLKGVFRCMRAWAARRFARGETGGSIINMASFAGLVADPMSAPYAATKGAVVQLTRTCAVEWARHGVRVNAIAPGYIRTPMTMRTLDDPELGRAVRERTPLGRAGTPWEVAGAAVFLASEAARYVTGHVLCVDGGWSAA